MLPMACETLICYRLFGEVILKLRLIYYKTRKFKIHAKGNMYWVLRLLHAHDFFWVVFVNYL